jgi:hypothetical protein
VKKKVSIVLCLLLLLAVSGCSFSISTAKVADAVSCREVDGDGKPIGNTDVFTTEDTAMYVSAKVVNVPSDTKLTILWRYSDGTETSDVDTVVMTLDDSRYVYSDLTAQDGLPPGTYTAELYIDDREKPDQTVTMTVE